MLRDDRRQGEDLVLYFSDLLGAITHCISDTDPGVRDHAERANKDLLGLVEVIMIVIVSRHAMKMTRCFLSLSNVC